MSRWVACRTEWRQRRTTLVVCAQRKCVMEQKIFARSLSLSARSQAGGATTTEPVSRSKPPKVRRPVVRLLIPISSWLSFAPPPPLLPTKESLLKKRPQIHPMERKAFKVALQIIRSVLVSNASPSQRPRYSFLWEESSSFS